MVMEYVTGCDDCNRLTSGRCWRHSITVAPTGFVQVIPSFVWTPVIVPLPSLYENLTR